MINLASRVRRLLDNNEELFGWTMISPAILTIIIFSTVPLLSLIGMSFFSINLAMPFQNGWNGIGNYIDLFNSQRFWSSFGFTAIYTSTTVFLQVTLGLGLAVVLTGAIKGKKILRTIVILPMIISPVVIGLFFRTLLLTPKYGLIDFFSRILGFGSYEWLTNPGLAKVMVVLIHTWQWTPFAFLVFIAALAALPDSLYEAASIDGASGWQKFRHLTLPLIRPAIIIVIVYRTMIAFRAFAAIFSATGGGPGTSTEILNLFAYRTSFTRLQLGYGASIATVLLILTTAVSIIFFRMRG